MARKPRLGLAGGAGGGRRLDLAVRLALALGSWVGMAAIAQGVVGAEIGRAVRQLDERIELRLKGGPRPDSKQPERTHDEPIEPWELMAV